MKKRDERISDVRSVTLNLVLAMESHHMVRGIGSLTLPLIAYTIHKHTQSPLIPTFYCTKPHSMYRYRNNITCGSTPWFLLHNLLLQLLPIPISFFSIIFLFLSYIFIDFLLFSYLRLALRLWKLIMVLIKMVSIKPGTS